MAADRVDLFPDVGSTNNRILAPAATPRPPRDRATAARAILLGRLSAATLQCSLRQRRILVGRAGGVSRVAHGPFRSNRCTAHSPAGSQASPRALRETASRRSSGARAVPVAQSTVRTARQPAPMVRGHCRCRRGLRINWIVRRVCRVSRRRRDRLHRGRHRCHRFVCRIAGQFGGRIEAMVLGNLFGRVLECRLGLDGRRNASRRGRQTGRRRRSKSGGRPLDGQSSARGAARRQARRSGSHERPAANPAAQQCSARISKPAPANRATANFVG